MSEKKNIVREKLKNALSYQQFLELSERNVKSVNPDLLNEADKAYYDYRKLNFARVSRLEKLYKPSEKALNIVRKISSPQIWLVITEDWCGDSAQTLPVIASLSELNENISLKIVLRDANLDLMDLYLTHGKRSIPKMISFDSELNELFQWGPRPHKAKLLVDELRKQDLSKQDIIKQLHLWYAKDGGYSTEEEIIELITINLQENSFQHFNH
ncbi:thioredoxin family protein [Ignavibacterium sp.]|uniref:thioredoxin family protein n=1 Tax=Ignavibacterium sp. TaxID=2651167 RepID=UPI00307D3DDB